MADAAVQHVQTLLARYSAGDQGAIDELIAPAFFTHAPSAAEPTATEIYAGFAAELKAAAPDLVIEIPDLAGGDDGLLRGTAVVAGTLTGPLWGVPPSGAHHRFDVPVTLRPIGERFAVNVELSPPEAVAILRSLDLVNPADQMHLPTRHPVVIADFLLKILFTGQVADKPCGHLDQVRVTRPATDRCEDCGPDGIWPALRMCLICGRVGCCDTATGHHAKVHWEETGHPLIRSIRMAERWIWCYEDAALFEGRVLDRIEARLADGL